MARRPSSPADPEVEGRRLHARVSIGGTELMGADIPTAEPMRSALSVPGVDSDGEAERIFAALSDGGKDLHADAGDILRHPIGQLRDRFGINWMILHERPMPGRT